MKIWIDLTNSPHVNFFAGMIRELEKEHQVVLTCRPLANTIELLDLFGFSYSVIGKHYGQNSMLKILGFCLRTLQLYMFLRAERINAAISHSGFNVPIVAKLLGVFSVYLNDNEHAAANRVSFTFASKIMVPEFLDLQKIRKQGAAPEKTIHYPGVKEGVYLWDYKPSSVSDDFKIVGAETKKRIFIRPEPWTAQYYKGKRNFIDDLLLEIKDEFSIVLLPRGKEQKLHYMKEIFKGIMVPEKSLNLSDIIENCDLFIGAGGTMTREAAVLGVPTISIYQDELLDVDRYLISKGAMVHNPNLTADFMIEYLEKRKERSPDNQLLRKGKEAYELIKKNLLGSRSESI